ncbi:MAG: ribonuclease HII [Candidatus Obscuribacterales bacterium]
MSRNYQQRLTELLAFDRSALANGGSPESSEGLQLKLFDRGYRLAVGVDEVGRGCLAGPVMAAAVVLPVMTPAIEESLLGLDDSKRLGVGVRTRLSGVLRSVAWYAFGQASHHEIDRVNILNASLLAMQRAVINLCRKYDLPVESTLVIVDGKKPLPDLPYCQLPVVAGDRHSAATAAASVVAKVERDSHMQFLSAAYPGYFFDKNKGYPSPVHIKSLGALGTSPVHRLSFCRGLSGV